MDDQNFEIGDVVYLNSGSPELTVSSIDENGKIIYVEWINDNGSNRASFFPEMLTKQKPNF